MFVVLLILMAIGSVDPSYQTREASFGEMGFYGDLTCFQGDSSRYWGGEAGVCFSPFRFTDVGIGFSLMSGNDQTFSFVNGRIGLLSPSLWKLRALCGVSVGIQVTAPGAYMADSDWPGRDEATGGWTLPYCGLEYMLRKSDSGYSLIIDSRVIFAENDVRRITAGIAVSKSIFSE